MTTMKLSELGRTYLENLAAIEAGRNAIRADAQAVLRAVEHRASKLEECEVALEGSSLVVRWPYEEKAADILQVEARLTWEGDRGWPKLSLNEHLDAPWKAILPTSMFEATPFEEADREALLADPVETCIRLLERDVDRLDDLVEEDDDLWFRYSVRQMMSRAIGEIRQNGRLPPDGGVEPQLKCDDAQDWPCYLEFSTEQIGRKWAYWELLFAPSHADDQAHRLLLLGNQVTKPDERMPHANKYYIVKDLGEYLTELEESVDDELPKDIWVRLASEVIELSKTHLQR